MAGNHGGRRAGAGRKPGVHIKRIQTSNLEALKGASAESVSAIQDKFGTDPRAFLASVMNRKNLPLDRRMRAAEILMPFAFPKLSASAVVSQRIDGNDPDLLIRTINERIERVSNARTIDAVPLLADAQ